MKKPISGNDNKSFEEEKPYRNEIFWLTACYTSVSVICGVFLWAMFELFWKLCSLSGYDR
jgi:hypothetical protein